MTQTHSPQPSYAELNAILDRVRRVGAERVQVTDVQLLGLQHRWTTALSARLDAALEFAGTQSLVDATVQAWRELAAEQAPLRAVLDAHLDSANSAELAAAQRHELRMLALAAGLCGLNTPTEEAARRGQALRDQIRSGRSSMVPELVGAA